MSDGEPYTPEHLELAEALVDADGRGRAQRAPAQGRRGARRPPASAPRRVAAEREQAANVLEAVGEGIFLA